MIVDNKILLASVTEMLAEGKDVVLKTKGGSMMPFIVGDKDSVLLRKEEWGVGDAVLAHLPNGHYVLHRVQSLDGDRVTLKGDGNLQGVEHCRKEDIAGRVVQVLKGDKVVDALDPAYKKKVARWNAKPYLWRRVVLGIKRRLI